MLRRLFGRKAPGPEQEARVPEGVRVYAVGDIHGRADLLRELHDLIADDAAAAPGLEKTIVYLGDYVDRGLESRGVIDLLLDSTPPGVAPVYLGGNHEDSLLRFLDDFAIGPAWIQLGGDATLYSYGVAFSGRLGEQKTLIDAQLGLKQNLPARHLAFLRGLKPYHEVGGYLFVHAGLRPGVPLDKQAPGDLKWIRREFLNSTVDHGRVVVHGHSISLKVEYRPNRVCIDTGAYATGVLTCLVLEGAERRLLQT